MFFCVLFGHSFECLFVVFGGHYCLHLMCDFAI